MENGSGQKYYYRNYSDSGLSVIMDRVLWIIMNK